MRKQVLAFALSVALLLTCCLSGLILPVAAASTDLIGDGDFESTLSTGWTWAGSAAVSIKNYAIVAAGSSPMSVIEEDDGNHCLMIPEMATESDGTTTYSLYDRYYQKAPVEPGKTYRLQLRYKGTGLRLYFSSTNCVSGAGVPTIAAADDWTEYSHTFTTKSETFNTNFVFAIGHSKTAGTVYVDDVQLVEVIEPESIAFGEATMMLGKGETKALPVTAQPDGAELDGAVTYTSSNTAAATVDANGKVTAVDYGVSYITAAVGDFTATCTVIVDPYVPVLLGDFEGDLSSGWTWTNTTYGFINSSSPVKVYTESDGNNCLRIPANGIDDGTGNITYPKYEKYYYGFPVETDTTYTLTFRYKGSGVKAYLGSCASGGGSKELTASIDWTTYSYTFTTKSTVSANFVFGLVRLEGETGDGYVDDVYLTRVSPFSELLADGDLQSTDLSDNWQKFETEEAKANVTHTADPEDATNRCLKFTGSKVCNYFGLSGAAADTHYKLTVQLKGSGKAQITFPNSYVVGDSIAVSGTEDYSISLGSTNKVYITAKSGWQTVSIVFKTNTSINPNYIFYAGSYGSGTTVYLDNFSMVELGGAYAVDGLVGGSVSLSDGTNSGSLLSGLLGKTVTATVTPADGYLLVPGSLRYITSDGITRRILNKNTATFGEGAGNTFAFDMPTENVRVLADFVKTDTTNFAWGTVGTAVRYNAEQQPDGLRFLTRVNMTAFDDEATGYSFLYEGNTYTVKSLGLLLKRAANDVELTVENGTVYATAAAEEKIWSVEVYSSASNTFRLTDYTDGYIDYIIAMTTSTPSDAFNSRLYTARGYLVLEKDGVETVLYANERTDSVNTALARLNGTLSEDEIISGDTSGDSDGADTTVTVPEDDKDYSNADLKILSIGNSYSQDAQKYLAALATAEGKTFKCVNLYKSGCALQTHYNGWTSGEAIYNYELNGVADYNTFVSLKAVLESDEFDVITLQQASWSSVNYSTFQPYLNDLITVLREKQPNATIYIHQTWAYGDASDNHTSNPTHTGGTMAAMWEKVETAYNSAATETGLPPIPSGQAIQLAQETLNKGGYSETSIQRDNAHVSYTWGRYLLARVWYQMLTGDIPTTTLDKLNSSVTADSAMETVVTDAVAAAFAEYAADPVGEEAAAA